MRIAVFLDVLVGIFHYIGKEPLFSQCFLHKDAQSKLQGCPVKHCNHWSVFFKFPPSQNRNPITALFSTYLQQSSHYESELMVGKEKLTLQIFLPDFWNFDLFLKLNLSSHYILTNPWCFWWFFFYFSQCLWSCY